MNNETDVRLPHAALVTAARREDALRRAEDTAMKAVCSGIGESPCGICRDCRKVQEHIHPDVITVGTAAEEGTGSKTQISVETVREMAADAFVLPNEAARKVYIIDGAERMNIPAQNAALKLLEEPPEWAVFLLCTVNADSLLPTVRSRCARLSEEKRTEAAPAEKNEVAAVYLKNVASGDRAALLRWCTAQEDMENADAVQFLESTRQLLADILCGRQKNSRKLSESDMMRLCALLDRCRDMLRVNTAVKHIFGLLAVDSIVGSGNRGSAN